MANRSYVLWSDETKINLYGSDGVQHLWWHSERSCVEASCNLSSLEEASDEEIVPSPLSDSFSDQYSDSTGCLQSPSLMTEILSEFMDVMKARELPANSSAAYLPPAVKSSSSSPASDLDSGPIAPPGCQLWRNCSQREGLTTFTVVPQRRQTSPKQYEVLITLEASQANEVMEIFEGIDKVGESLEWGNQELENYGPKEQYKNETQAIQGKVNGEDLEHGDAQLGILEAAVKEFPKLNLDVDVEKQIAEEMEDQVLGEEEEKEEEKDWVEKYKERRRKFQGNDRKPVKLDKWMKDFEEELGYTIEDQRKELDNGFPPPSPHCRFYWEEDKHSRGTEEGVKEFKADKMVDDKDSSLGKDESLAYNVPDPYWDVNHCSKLNSSVVNLDTQDHVQSASKTCSSNTHQPKIHATVNLPSPAPVSLFALAVARRAQTLQEGVCG